MQITSAALSHSRASILRKENDLFGKGSDPFAGPLAHTLQWLIPTCGEDECGEGGGQHHPAYSGSGTSLDHSH